MMPFLAIARIALKVLAELAAIVLRFFTNPVEQIPSKIIAVVLALAIGGVLGDIRGRHHERAIWKAREAEHAEAMELLRETTAEAARAEVTEAQDKEQAHAFDVSKQIEVYAQAVPRPDPGACRISGADLRAAGLRDGGHVDRGRNPGRLQRPARAGRAR